jgi:hypothetical protein
MGATLEPDLVEAGKIWKRTEIPILQCPSDRYTHQQGSWGTGTWTAQPISCYDDVGTSYQYNFHALDPYTATAGGAILWNGNPPENGAPDVTKPTAEPTWSTLGRVLVKQALAKHSASFLMYLEDPMDYALYSRLGEIGNHGKFNRNCLGFLDGHAAYMATDTRSWCGLGWEAINQEWVQRVGQGMPRPVAYSDVTIDCNPR